MMTGNKNYSMIGRTLVQPVLLLLTTTLWTCSIATQSASASSGPDRYSRQVYAVGARAHGLMRKSVIFLDGPISDGDGTLSPSRSDYSGDDYTETGGEARTPRASGLLLECAKNLALSGVGEIIFLLEDADHDESRRCTILHESFSDKMHLDDLGRIYLNAAEAECNDHADGGAIELIMEYIRRLNPQVKVSYMNRHEFISTSGVSVHSKADREMALVCIDRPEATQELLSSTCRVSSHRVKFVSVETQGLYGRIFCDFGNDFEVQDEDGESPRKTLVESVKYVEAEKRDLLVVNCIDGERHDVSRGDIVQFDQIEGRYRVERVDSPSRFIVHANPSDSEESQKISTLQSPIVVERIKQPRSIPFVSFGDAIKLAKSSSMPGVLASDVLPSVPTDHQLFTPSDLDKSFDDNRRSAIMAAFAAASTFAEKWYRTPSETSKDDFVAFFEMVKLSGFVEETSAEWKDIVRDFYHCYCKGGKLAPLQAFFGALASQEALKAVSGLYNPISQFLIYDCDELGHVKTEREEFEDFSGFLDTASGQSSIIGKAVTARLASQRIFVVGSGAIGCELLKNLAAMGAGSFAQGAIILTDMDTIEHSNLSRQLLFRDSDVGNFKSIAAKEAISRFNPAVRLEAHSSKVGDDERGPFDDEFWMNGVDVVLNALDNVDARLFIDSKCVDSQKGLIDAGTLGSKGNVQIVVPMQSESYGSSADPPEPNIPVCTLKNFPYEISHTIQWGRDLFDGLFNRRPTQANSGISSLASVGKKGFGSELLRKLGGDAAIEAATEIGNDLCTEWFAGRGSDQYGEQLMMLSISWAIELAQSLFSVAIENLLSQHPEDSVDEDGKPFWTGTRRQPKISFYDNAPEEDNVFQQTVNEQIVDFVQSAARLRMETYVHQNLMECHETKPTKNIVLKALEQFENTPSAEDVDNTGSAMSRIVTSLQGTDFDAETTLNPVEFEKDEESNGHVSFITAASNLRALSYGITPVDEMETRRIAGRIVPAMITTTALVSALSSLELLKLIQSAPLKIHRNAFINLALPFFALTSPLPAEEIVGVNGKTHTIWDKIVVREKKQAANAGGMTMKQLMKKVEKASGAPVTSLSYGPYLLYANFLHDCDDELMDKAVAAVVLEALLSEDEMYDIESKEIYEQDQGELEEDLENKMFLDFMAVAEDVETGEELELPPIRLVKYARKSRQSRSSEKKEAA